LSTVQRSFALVNILPVTPLLAPGIILDPNIFQLRPMPWKNFGKVTNQGVEVSLNVNKQFGKDLFVSLMGTFTYAHNERYAKRRPPKLALPT
jgi:outer membrane receptor for ferrienterochelin and colicin